MWVIETLSKEHERPPFGCGEPGLDDWLKQYARQSDERNETLTRVAVEPGQKRILGYYSTRSFQLEGEALQSAIGGQAKYPVPCMLLARLARCESVRGQGMGEFLLAHALRASTRVSEWMGLKFVVVHALNEKAAAFYEEFGFERFVDHEQHLLMSVKEIRKALET